MNIIREHRSSFVVINWAGLFLAFAGLIFLCVKIQPLIEAQIYRNTIQDAYLVSNRLENLTGDFRHLLIILSQDASFRSLSPGECNRKLSGILEEYTPDVLGIGVADTEGRILCLSNIHTEGQNYTITGDSFYTNIIDSQEFTVGEYRSCKMYDNPVIAFGLPMKNADGSIQSILFAFASIDKLNELVGDASVQQDTAAFLLDRKNTVLAQYPEPDNWTGKTFSLPDYQSITGENQSVYITWDENGTEIPAGSVPLMDISSNDMQLLVAATDSSRLFTLSKMLLANVILLVAGIFSLLFLYGLFNKKPAFETLPGFLQALSFSPAQHLQPAGIGTPVLRKKPHTADRASGFKSWHKKKIIPPSKNLQADLPLDRGKILSSTIHLLTAQNTLHDLLSTACEAIVHDLHIAACSIRLYDTGQDAFLPEAHFQTGEVINFEAAGLPRRVYEQYETPHDAVTWFHYPQFNPELPADISNLPSSWQVAAVKLTHNRQLLGLLLFYAADSHSSARLQDSLLIDGLAGEIGVTIANMQLINALEKEQTRHSRLIKSIVRAQEEERLRIARELHDETIQSLSAINIYIDTAVLSLEESGATGAIGHMKSIKKLVNRIMDEFRRLLSALRPSILDDMGLVPAVSWYAEQRLTPMGITCSIGKNNAMNDALSLAVETTIYRIAQETINNIARHSKASHADLSFQRREDDIVFIIADNGIGISERDRQDILKSGIGLKGICERVENIGGSMQIDSGEDCGVKVTIHIPVYKEKGSRK